MHGNGIGNEGIRELMSALSAHKGASFFLAKQTISKFVLSGLFNPNYVHAWLNYREDYSCGYWQQQHWLGRFTSCCRIHQKDEVFTVVQSLHERH